MVVADFETIPQRSKPMKRSVYRFQKADWDKIKADMDLLAKDIESMYDNNSTVNDLWEFFKDMLKKSMDKTHSNIIIKQEKQATMDK